MPDYRIQPLPVPDEAYFAFAVRVDDDGRAWLGEVGPDEVSVVVYTDAEGKPLPAPDAWRERIVAEL